MSDEQKTKKELVAELAKMRQRVAELEASSEAKRKRVEEALRESEKKYHSLFESMLNGFAYCKIILDENNHPIDFVYLEINDAFERLTGLRKQDVLGKRVTEAIPTIKDTHPELFEIYGKVALTGQETQFDLYFEPLEIWLSISVYSPQKGYFVAVFENITERKLAEERLAYQSHLLANVNDAILATDDQFIVTAWNRAAEEIHGWKAEEAIGRVVQKVIPSDLTDVQRAEALRTLAEEGRYRSKVSTYRKDGQQIYVEGTTVALRGEDGRITGYVSVNRDVTERKRAEEALRRAEREWKSTFAAMSDWVSLIDPQTHRILRSNRAGEEFVGLPLPKMAGQTCCKLVHGSDRPIPGCPLQKMLDTRQPETVEFELPGRERWLMVTVDPVMDENGNLVGAVHIVRDITERKWAEEALRESEEKYRTILESIEDGYYEVDLAGNLTFFNDSLCEMLGYPSDELMGLNYREFMTDEMVRLVYQSFNKVYQTGESTRSVGWELVRKDGDRRSIEASISPIRDPTGETTGFRGIARDITERKHLEEQIRQQERLATVGQLAAGIAHDFNNLLATIILYSQMSLGKRDLSPDVRRASETILAESRRAAQLVQQILDFSRSAMIETRPLDLASFTEKVFGVLRRTIPESIRLTLAVELEEYAAADRGRSALTVKADPTRIQQALMNLATNARDAMPEGGELHVGLSRVMLKPGEKFPMAEMDSGEWVCLAVSDTGTGMTEEVQDHLFEPFFTTKPVGEGTGLGLPQVYGIVKQHEGHIGVETAVGEGTTFRIYLPAYEEKGEEVEVKEPSALPQGRGETILVVEDEARLRKAMGEILESLGYRVLSAANGREALEMYRSAAEVDLVLADLVMPEMGGKQLIRELKRENPDLKALAITGYVMDVDLQELGEAGFLGVVNKPFDTDRLAQVVRRALDVD